MFWCAAILVAFDVSSLDQASPRLDIWKYKKTNGNLMKIQYNKMKKGEKAGKAVVMRVNYS
jgi:hypothetical protein